MHFLAGKWFLIEVYTVGFDFFRQMKPKSKSIPECARFVKFSEQVLD